MGSKVHGHGIRIDTIQPVIFENYNMTKQIKHHYHTEVQYPK